LTTPRRRVLKYSPEPLSSGDSAESTVQAFGGLFQHVLNTTITRDHIRVSPFTRGREWTDWQWVISRATDLGEPLPLSLNGSTTWLLAEQRLGVGQSSSDGQLWLTTLQYRYRWQADEDDGTWLVRWDYRRGHAPHVHVNSVPQGWAAGRHFHKLHMPTRRVAIEDVVRFLILEEIVEPRSPNWEETLEVAAAIFDRIQHRAREDELGSQA
jgi:hypothetical protein